MPERSRHKNHRLQGARWPPPRMTYTWWIHPKRTTATMRMIHSRISLLRYSQSADISSTALNHAVEKTTIPAHDKIILQMAPKTTKTPLSQLPNRMNGRMGESALMNRPLPKTRRTVIIFHTPRMRQASARKTLLCLRSPLIRSALSAG